MSHSPRGLFFDGQWQSPGATRSLPCVDPATGEVAREIARCDASDVDRAVVAADRAFRHGPWPRMTTAQRAAQLLKLADAIAENADALAEAETGDNGKLIAETSVQMRAVPEWFRYYAGLIRAQCDTVLPVDKPGIRALSRREPMGVVAALTPWNSPLMLLAWKLAPALAAGNTVVVKPSEFASSTAMRLMDIAAEAGLPAGVLNLVTGLGQEAGAALIAHPLVNKIAFTGSDATGARIYQSAAADLKRVTLELGGKSPNIVFADADVASALNGAVAGIFAAGGQTCLAGSRILVQRPLYEQFVSEFAERAEAIVVGHPRDPATQMGPIATAAQLEKVQEYVAIARAEGARCVAGGKRIDRPGYYYRPTVFAEVHNGMRIAREEVFGPVACIMPFQDDEEALAIANDTPYGLAAGVWTRDPARAMHFSAELRCGTVWVNTYRAVHYASPFGGRGRSGVGSENGPEGLDSYQQTKAVWVNFERDTANPFVVR